MSEGAAERLDALEARLEKLAALENLTPELADLTVRAIERRARTGRAAGEVTKNEWTLDEARLHGLRRSLVSALRAHQNSEEYLARAQGEWDRTKGDVDMVQGLLDQYLEAHPELA